MTSEINIDSLTFSIDEKPKTEEEELGNFRGTCGPLEDEIHIRKFYEKHKNTPLFNGAFKQCKINGIASQKDTQRYNDWFWRSIFTLSISIGVSTSICFVLSDIKVVKISNPGIKFYASLLTLPLLFSGGLSYYKYQQMKSELDKKYTPIYMKSRGKL